MDPLSLARAGYAVFPVNAQKEPLTKNGHHDATTDIARVKGWWKRWPEALIGLPTGKKNGIAVLDIDRKNDKDGFATLSAMGLDPRSSVTVTTRSGGEHRYFKWQEGLTNAAPRGADGKVLKGVDVRGEGGWVVAWDGGEALLDDVVGLLPWPKPLRPAPREKAEPKDPVGLTRDQAREILDGLDLDEWCEEREGWLKTGMALHSEFGDEGRELWDEFSEQSGKFSEGGQDKAWNSFRDKPGGVTMRTLIKETGWDRLDDDAVDAAFEAVETKAVGEKFKVETYDEDDQTPENVSSYNAALRLNKDHAAVLTGGQYLIINEVGDEVDFYSDTAMAKWFKNRRLTFKTPTGQNTTKPISEVWQFSKRRRSYKGIEFHPGRKPSTWRDGRGGDKYNLWRGWSVKPNPKASCARFLWHLEHIVCNGNQQHFQWALRWLAHMVQKPWEKPGSSLILKGKRGTGKDLVAIYLGKMFKRHYVPVSQPRHVTGNFNNHMASCLLLHIEEGAWAGNRQEEQILKHIITSEIVQIEKKGVDPVAVRSCFRIIETSNENWSVPAAEGERRFFVLDVSDRKMQDEAYFNDYADEMNGDGPAALLHYLMNVDLTGFNVRKPPHTEALYKEQLQGLRGVDWWWADLLEDGEMPSQGWDGDEVWPEKISMDDLYNDYVRKLSDNRYKGVAVSKRFFSRSLKAYGISMHREGKGGTDKICTIKSLSECRRLFRQKMKGG